MEDQNLLLGLTSSSSSVVDSSSPTTTTTTSNIINEEMISTTTTTIPFRYVRYTIPLKKFISGKNNITNLVPPPTLPPQVIDHPKLQPDEWIQFWKSKVQPIIFPIYKPYPVQLSLFVLWWMVVIFILPYVSVDDDMYYFLFHKQRSIFYISPMKWSGIVLLVLCVCAGQRVPLAHKRLVRLLRNMCMNEERRLFRNYGYIVECSFEADNTVCLYFIQYNNNNNNHRCDNNTNNERSEGDEYYYHNNNNNGIHRIELYHPGEPIYFRWTPISTTRLASYNNNKFPMVVSPTIAIHNQQLLDLIWDRFWTEIQSTSKQVLIWHRLFHVCLWSNLVFYFMVPPQRILLTSVTSTLVLLCVMVKRVATVKYLSELVQKYSPEFRQHNIRVEYRNVLSEGFLDGYIHSIDIIPLVVVPRVQQNHNTAIDENSNNNNESPV